MLINRAARSLWARTGWARQTAACAAPKSAGIMDSSAMYAWWNGAALSNPMAAILSNEAEWDGDRFFDTGKTWLAEHRAFAALSGITLQGARALDFGCGIGRMTAALAEHYSDVVGVDISDEMVRLAASYSRRANTRFLQMRDLPLPFTTQEFDCVYSCIVLQHIPFPLSLDYLKEFFRVSSRLVLVDIPSHARGTQPPGAGIFLTGIRHVIACAELSSFDLVGLRDFPATAARQYQYLFLRVDRSAARAADSESPS